MMLMTVAVAATTMISCFINFEKLLQAVDELCEDVRIGGQQLLLCCCRQSHMFSKLWEDDSCPVVATRAFTPSMQYEFARRRVRCSWGCAVRGRSKTQKAGHKHAVGDSIPNCMSTVAARQKVHSLDPLLEIVIIVIIRRRGGHCNLQLPCASVCPTRRNKPGKVGTCLSKGLSKMCLSVWFWYQVTFSAKAYKVVSL